MAKQKRDMSWLKDGVKVWWVRGTSVHVGTVSRQHIAPFFREEGVVRSVFLPPSQAYPTAEEAYRAAAMKCEKRAKSLSARSIAMWKKSYEYYDKIKACGEAAT